ncbi:MAG: hypothetical protein AYK22_08600 [Thermoplasmatales archaeon SG8-52-3]|nr:MAG: hypothetical protein AYK22_08600 [Thermoplasmatales archaeon SG8-52-3]
MQKGRKDHRIMVIDDEPLIRDVLSRFLLDFGLQAKAVVTAEEALDEIRVQYYDLCFLDYILPGMTGLEALKKINELSPTTKVVIMTGTFFDEATIEYIKEHSYAFIEKPFSLSQISKVIKSMVFALPAQQMIWE